MEQTVDPPTGQSLARIPVSDVFPGCTIYVVVPIIPDGKGEFIAAPEQPLRLEVRGEPPRYEFRSLIYPPAFHSRDIKVVHAEPGERDFWLALADKLKQELQGGDLPI